jgi:hypothetical protein
VVQIGMTVMAYNGAVLVRASITASATFGHSA